MKQDNHNIIDDVLKNTDIIELISETTTLEKKGKNHMGLCPFHDEKTPSFSVSEDKQLYHCFSCKKSGNAINFVEDTKGVTRQEALKYLAKRAGVDLKDHIKQDPLDHYYAINQKAVDFYKVNLRHTKQGAKALRYLQDRHITTTTMDTFDIGLAPLKKDGLYQALKKDDHLDSDLKDLALITQFDPPYDQFRNRIMFTLHNEFGQPVGFSGRIFNGDSDQAKYINSPTTKTFEKNRILYNLHRAKKAIKTTNRAVLFEGFMDVIMAHQAGVEEGLAVMGTALSDTHIKQIKQHTHTLILCFDGDQAGKQATFDMFKQLNNHGLNLYVAPMPEKTDPDDYINTHGKQAFKALIDDPISIYEFTYNEHIKKVNQHKILDIEQFKKMVFKLIKPLSAVEQDHYLNKLASDLNLNIDILKQDFTTIKPSLKRPSYQKTPPLNITDKFRKAERGFIHYFLKDEYYSRRFRKAFEDVSYIDKEARDIQLEIFEHYDLRPHTCIVIACFKQRLTPKQKTYFETHIDFTNYPYQQQEFEDYIHVMHEYNRRTKINHYRKQMKKASTIEEKIILRQKIDKMIKEDNDGKRKDHSRTY